MKAIIEIENEEELRVNRDKLDKIREILPECLIVKHENSVCVRDIFEKIEAVSWNMGKKFFTNREELHER